VDGRSGPRPGKNTEEVAVKEKFKPKKDEGKPKMNPKVLDTWINETL